LYNIPEIVLTDHSTFGTFINEKKVEDFKKLKENDIIRFGTGNTSIYKLINEKLVVSTSSLRRVDQESGTIHQIMSKLGGYVLSEWHPSCQFLIMDKILTSIKAISILANQGYIVTIGYFKDLLKSIENKVAKLPEPNKFVLNKTIKIKSKLFNKFFLSILVIYHRWAKLA
jgi:pSer/pThr/pTyr-binding forkhead associated (FHA) protein